MRHNPADPDWAGRDRFVLSAGHCSLTLYTQLYLAGFGLELDDLKALRTWGSKTPGHPEHGHTAGVETTTGPLGQGVGNAVGMAMAARRERGLFDPDAAPGESPFDHQIYAICSDGDLEEGVSAEASSLAGTSSSATSTLIYDDNEISIEDDTDIAFTEDVAARYAAYGWHVQRIDWTNGGTGYDENVQALWDALEKARRGHRPAQLHRAAHDHRLAGPERAEHRQVARLRARRRRGRGHQEDPRLRPRADLRGRRRRHRAHPQAPSSAASRREAEWQESFDAWATRYRRAQGAASTGCAPARCPPAGTKALPSFDADAKGVATRKASGEVLTAIAPELPELWGGSADLAGPTTPPPRASRPSSPPEHATKEFQRRPVRPGAALRHPRARAWARS